MAPARGEAVSNAGQAALGIVGGIIGYFVGGPQGAAYGFQLGLAVGTVVSPTQLPGTFGPRLTDNRTTTSQIGAPVTIVFGTDAVPGVVIWLGDIKETSTTTEVGGKGAPEQNQTTFSYSQPIAISLCAGVMGGIRRVWENGKLVYDVRPQQTGESDDQFANRLAASTEYSNGFTLYQGTETQMPDPTIEAKEGMGNVPAYRGLMYVVYHDRQLRDDQARRHPNFKFEVFEGAIDCEDITEYSNEVLYQWASDAAIQKDPTNPANLHSYYLRGESDTALPDFGPGSAHSTLDAALADSAAWASLSPPRPEVSLATVERIGWSISASIDNWSSAMRPDIVSSAPGERLSIYLHLNSPTAGGNFAGFVIRAPFNSFAGYSMIVYEGVTFGGPYKWWTEQYTAHDATPEGTLENQYNLGLYYWNDFGAEIYGNRERFVNNVSAFDGVPPPADGNILFLPDVIVQVTRLPSAPSDPCHPTVGPTPPAYGDGFCIVDGLIRESAPWEFDDSQNYNMLQAYGSDGTGEQNAVYPLNPALPVGHEDDTSEFWTAAYEEAVAQGLMPAGLIYGIHYPTQLDHGYRRDVRRCIANTDQVSIASIVRRICALCTLTEELIDVSELEDRFVTGYQIGRVTDGRSAIEPTRSVGFFDAVESGGILKFPVRGKALVRQLEEADIGAHEFGGDAPPLITTRKQQEVELPRKLFVQYRDPARDYEIGEQASPTRLITDAVNDVYVDVAVAIDATTALRCAEVLWADQWAARWRHDIACDQAQIELEPTDCITVPVDGRYERMRIVSLDDSAVILRQMTLVRDDDGAYVSTVVADAPTRPPQSIVILSPSELFLLDIPALRTEDNDIGVYAVVEAASEESSWSGAVIFQSLNGGSSFDEMGSVLNQATQGTLDAPFAAGDTTVWDDATEVLVTLTVGALESRPDADVFNGANTIAIGANGRWEILQFGNAEQAGPTQWTLTHLLRGRRGTEHLMATQEAGDRWILVSGAGVIRIPLANSNLGTAVVYRAVSIGAPFTSGTDETFTSAGVARLPFSPVMIEGQRDTSENLELTWIRRDRLGAELPDGDEIAMSDPPESYEIDILGDSPPVVIRTLSSSTTSVTYTAADQTTDFGAPQDSITVAIYQISSVVGRGTPGTATV